jgi:uncharacterized 2Fe-2S/4Fe-4S cluster protein (DUF4445 family)
MPRVVFTPSGLETEVPTGTTVLDAARRLGVDLDSVCGGRGICGRCQISPNVGSFAKWSIDSAASALSPSAEIEATYHGRRPLEDRRLGCAAHVQADVVVDVPAESQVHRQVVRKAVNLDDLVLDPLFVLCYIEVPLQLLGDARSVYDSMVDALAEQHNRKVRRAAPHALSSLHKALDHDDRCATVALRMGAHGDEIVAAWPGFVDAAYGIAVDIGSTTIAGHLVDLATGEVVASGGRMNPQIRFGEDLMSRVSYVMMNPGGDKELTSAIRTALNELTAELIADAMTDATKVLDVVLVGNPIMHHVVLGIDPTPLGMAPFTLATAEAVNCQATDLNIDLPHASVYLLPCIAGHVGADTAAAILAEGPHRSDTFQLLVDVGTNAEIVLGSKQFQFAASSPTGPAFEGAQLSCGQRATAGAIERVRIDRSSLEPRIKVIGCDLWSDEDGFAEGTKDLSISGVCGSGIIEVVAEMYLSGVIAVDGTIVGTAPSPRIIGDGRTFSYRLYQHDDVDLHITQNDVRAIQLAKAALRAGIDLLVQQAGLTELTDIRLAGAFGSHIDPLYALVLGLVPDCPPGGVRAVGNAAGAGAVRALLSKALRQEIEHTVQGVVKIETAIEPKFQELFVAAMAFPHATAPTPYLATQIALPARTEADDAAAQGGRRRRRPTSTTTEVEELS